MSEKRVSDQSKPLILVRLKDELTGSAIYSAMARQVKAEGNRAILEQIAAEEEEHARFWQEYVDEKPRPGKVKVLLYWLLGRVFGYTCVLKLIQKSEQIAVAEYETLGAEVPEAIQFAEQEHRHETELIEMLDEERLQYVGSMVLGLNDALVELTGALAGLTFALRNTRVIALSGIITGLSATLSMAASNYLAERSDGNENAFKSSVYTGIAYLITVALLVLPYLMFPEALYAWALGTMLFAVVLVIFVFNYYISVAKGFSFKRRFGEMAAISLSVAAISFLIGIAAKELLGVNL